MPTMGVVYAAGGQPKGTWFWPDPSRVCPFDVAVAPGDQVALITDATETEYEAVSRATPARAGLAARYPAGQLEILTVPAGPAPPAGQRLAFQPGYRRLVTAPVDGATVEVAAPATRTDGPPTDTTFPDHVLAHTFPPKGRP